MLEELTVFKKLDALNRYVLILCFCLFSLQAFSGTQSPIVITDVLGREVVLAKPPQRIVTIFSSNAEIVVALGLIDRIVGIDAYTTFPASLQNKAKIGGRLGFSLEKIVEQQPDLVIMTPARQATHQLLPPLEKLGVPTMVLQARSVEEIINNIELVAQATGQKERGKKLTSQMHLRLDKVASKSKHNRKPKVVLITGRVGNGLLLVARGTNNHTNGYTADIILKAGGTLALDETLQRGPQLNQISPEVLLATDPDIVLFAGSKMDLDELRISLPAWSKMKAAQTGFVYNVSRSELLISGPRVVNGVENLAIIFEKWNKIQ